MIGNTHYQAIYFYRKLIFLNIEENQIHILLYDYVRQIVKILLDVLS